MAKGLSRTDIAHMFRHGYTRALMGGEADGLGGFSGEGERRDRGEPFHRNRVVAPVSVTAAGLSLFFNVPDFAAGRYLAILADHAPAGEGGEAEKPNETHHTFLPEQILCR